MRREFEVRYDRFDGKEGLYDVQHDTPNFVYFRPGGYDHARRWWHGFYIDGARLRG